MPAESALVLYPFVAALLGPIPVGPKKGFVGVERSCLGVVLADELRRLGRTFREPRLLKNRRHVGVGGEALPPRVVPVEDDPDAVGIVGIAEDVAPLDPCCPRFSAPWVEKTFQNWSKSATFAVARTILVLPLSECYLAPSTLRLRSKACSCSD